MAIQVIASADVDVCISLIYDATGIAEVHMFPNTIFGWAVDDTDINHPKPVILGSASPAPPNTAPIISPIWAWWRPDNDLVSVPDTWRGTTYDFIVWIATNNGARRKIVTVGETPKLVQQMNHFRVKYPELAPG